MKSKFMTFRKNHKCELFKTCVCKSDVKNASNTNNWRDDNEKMFLKIYII